MDRRKQHKKRDIALSFRLGNVYLYYIDSAIQQKKMDKYTARNVE